MFDGARAGSRMSDFVALIISWLAVVWLAVIGIWGRSVVLGLLAGLGFAFVVHWTIAKWRDHALAVRLQRTAPAAIRAETSRRLRA